MKVGSGTVGNISVDDDWGNSSEVIQELMAVYNGCTGAIIGKKGTKIKEIRAATGIKDIKMPRSNHVSRRLQSHELVQITIRGTKVRPEYTPICCRSLTYQVRLCEIY